MEPIGCPQENKYMAAHTGHIGSPQGLTMGAEESPQGAHMEPTGSHKVPEKEETARTKTNESKKERKRDGERERERERENLKTRTY